MKRILTVLLTLCLCIVNAQAQAVVKSMTETNDFIPSKDQRKDYNKQLCALVKVQVVDEITDVEGSVMGDVVNCGVEKWVYMAQGSRNLKIHLKKNLPVKVMFKDYGINGLKSNRIYELVINVPNEDTIDVKQRLIINYTPANATVMIDNKIVKGDGRIELELPIGDHNYTIAADSYVTAQSTVKLNKEAPREITERLVKEGNNMPDQAVESITIGLNGNLFTLKVKPFYAKIKIDGKAYDADNKGELTTPLLSGFHQISVEAEGYKPNVTNINVKAKKSGKKKIKLKKQKNTSSIKLKKGMVVMNEGSGIEIGKNGNVLIITAKPTNGIKLNVDGIDYKPNNNYKVKSMIFYLPYGTHEIKADCKGYVTNGFTVNIGKSKVKRKIKLKKLKKGMVESVTSQINGNTIIPGQNGNELIVSVKPIYANIFIDGDRYSAKAKGKLIVNLPFGIHKIVAEADGYLSEQTTVNIGKKSAKAKIKLKRKKR